MCSCAEYRFSAHSTWLCVSKGSIKLFHTIQPSDTNFSANERTTTKTNACLPFFLGSFFVTWTWTCCSKWTNTSWCFGNVQLLRTVVWPWCFFHILLISRFLRWLILWRICWTWKLASLWMCVCQTVCNAWRHNNDSQLNATCVCNIAMLQLKCIDQFCCPNKEKQLKNPKNNNISIYTRHG